MKQFKTANESFKSLEEFKQWLTDNYDEPIALFENPDYFKAIIGVADNGAVIYDFELMVECLMEEDPSMTDIDAVEFIEYNTIRTIPYISNDVVKPIILHQIEY